MPQKQSFSGADISVVIVFSGLSPTLVLPERNMKVSAEIHTLTISSTTSVLPVRRFGEAKPETFTKGARTFAGSMIFSVLDKDPFQELFALDAMSSTVAHDGAWHIDQMPPFDIIITATNEAGDSGVQLMSDVVLTNWGTTYSVDDIFTESTYTYMAEHVTPFVKNPIYSRFLKAARAHFTANKTPDDIFTEIEVDLPYAVRGGTLLADGIVDPIYEVEAAQSFDEFINHAVSSAPVGSVFATNFVTDPVLKQMWLASKQTDGQPSLDFAGGSLQDPVFAFSVDYPDA